MKGTVKKDGSSWYYLVSIGKDPKTGKYKYKKKRGFKTKKECETALAKFIVEIESGTVIENDKMTLAEYLDYWMETYVKANCSPSTYKRYSFSVNDIKKYLGKTTLIKLNPLLIEKFYKDVIADKGISQNTLLKTHRTFHKALKNAQQWQLIHTNPCELVNKPKENKKDIQYWSPSKVKVILKKLEGHRLYPITYLACYTGLRDGELCALKWKDIDLSKGLLSVSSNLSRDLNNKLIASTPKTSNSYRIITLFPQTIEFLKKFKYRDDTIRNDDEYIFAWEDGRPLDPHYVSRNFKSMLDWCGIDKEDWITFHGTRHTNATLLLAAGVKEKVISKRLGHSNVAFTMDTYTHSDLEIEQKEIKKASKFL